MLVAGNYTSMNIRSWCPDNGEIYVPIHTPHARAEEDLEERVQIIQNTYPKCNAEDMISLSPLLNSDGELTLQGMPTELLLVLTHCVIFHGTYPMCRCAVWSIPCHRLHELVLLCQRNVSK